MNKVFDTFSRKATKATGSSWAFIICVLLFIVWAIWAYFRKFDDFSQLLLSTVTSIITTLMVFLIQQSSNKDTSAVQTKLDELIRAVDNAKNDFRGIENKTEAEIISLKEN